MSCRLKVGSQTDRSEHHHHRARSTGKGCQYEGFSKPPLVHWFEVGAEHVD
jgi:hypothetical protein